MGDGLLLELPPTLPGQPSSPPGHRHSVPPLGAGLRPQVGRTHSGCARRREARALRHSLFSRRPARSDRGVLKAREPARILVSIGKSATEQGHLLYKQRWVDQHNFYIHDRAWGRMFVRLALTSPSPPASTSTNTTGWRSVCRNRGFASSCAPMLSCGVATPATSATR
jgi:hypothetical protein